MIACTVALSLSGAADAKIGQASTSREIMRFMEIFPKCFIKNDTADLRPSETVFRRLFMFVAHTCQHTGDKSGRNNDGNAHRRQGT